MTAWSDGDAESAALERLGPAQLARLLDADASQPTWTRADAAGALVQQLQAPLLPDVANVPGAEPERLEALVRTHAPAQSFGDLLAASDPDIDLLHAIKDWARFWRTQTASPLHGAPATVFYFAAIAAALLHRGQRITRLTDTELREGFSWAAQVDGAQELRALLEAALLALPPALPPRAGRG